MTVKTRNIDHRVGAAGVERFYDVNGSLLSNEVWTTNVSGVEELISSGHKWPPAKGTYGDVGGAFSVRKRTITHKPAEVGIRTEYFNQRTAREYTGLLFVARDTHINYNVGHLPPLVDSWNSTAKGTKAWSRFKPTRSAGGLGQAIAELHDVKSLFDLPKIYAGLKFFKTLGNEYLRQEFGWKPFIKDVKDFCKNVHNADDRIRQLVRDNGKNIRRRGTLSKNEQHDVNVIASTYFTYPPLTSGMFDGTHRVTETTRLVTEDKFSGSFKYWIDPRKIASDSERANGSKQQLTRIVYGLDLSPSLVWNVMPWSWLVDWFGNVGAQLDNLNDKEDNLTAMYAYLMQRTTWSRTTVVSGKYRKGPSSVSFEAETTSFSQTKQRQGASPFGFGLSIPNLNLRQQAILAALGVQRLR